MDSERPAPVPQCYRLERVGSTMDVVLRHADVGAPEHTVVVAREETEARGGSGRWFAPPGGLWLSMLWRPMIDACNAALLTLAAGWGVREGVRRATGVAAGLKWPNDLVVDGRKLGGVLVEGRVFGHDVVASAVGVGVNGNNPVQALPPTIADRATSLQAITGRDLDLEDLLDHVTRGLRDARGLLSDRDELLRAFNACWTQKGQFVCIDSGHAIVEGRAERVDPDGALVIRTVGAEHRVDDPSLAKFVRVV